MKSKVIKQSTGPGDVLLGEGELSYLDQHCTYSFIKFFYLLHKYTAEHLTEIQINKSLNTLSCEIYLYIQCTRQDLRLKAVFYMRSFC